MWRFLQTLLLCLAVSPSLAQEPAAQEDAPPPPDESMIRSLTTPFEYSRDKQRDPFQLPTLQVRPLEPGAIFGPLLELQEVNLDSITVKGVIIDPAKPKALLSFRNYRGEEQIIKVTIGDYVGENFGQVQAIREGKVIILQTLEERGRKYTTTRTLTGQK